MVDKVDLIELGEQNGQRINSPHTGVASVGKGKSVCKSASLHLCCLVGRNERNAVPEPAPFRSRVAAG